MLHEGLHGGDHVDLLLIGQVEHHVRGNELLISADGKTVSVARRNDARCSIMTDSRRA